MNPPHVRQATDAGENEALRRMSARGSVYHIRACSNAALEAELGDQQPTLKTCTCSPMYCQRGKNLFGSDGRDVFYSTYVIRYAYLGRLPKTVERGEQCDCISFVPDGQPTLETRRGGRCSPDKGETPSPMIEEVTCSASSRSLPSGSTRWGRTSVRRAKGGWRWNNSFLPAGSSRDPTTRKHSTSES